MLRVPDEVFGKAGLLGDLGNELLVVKGDAQLLGQPLGDEPPAGAILPADGNDDMVHNNTSCLLLLYRTEAVMSKLK